MDIKILRNKVYLTLLSFYDGGKMPTITELSRNAGVSRQTTSKYLKRLIDEGIVITHRDFIEVKNDLNLNVRKITDYLCENIYRFDAIQLYNKLYEDNHLSRREIGEKLGMARQTIYNDNCNVVYGIVYNSELKYIGSTCHYKQTCQQLIREDKFPVELTQENFIVLLDNIPNPYMEALNLVREIQPEWNIVHSLDRDGNIQAYMVVKGA